MKTIISLLLLSTLALTSCTDNARVKNFGGTAVIDLPKGEKLINITWKETEIWYLTRKMRSDETAEQYTFREKSSLGMVEGSYIIKESK